MGRPLYSQSYYPTPVAKAEPEPEVTVYDKWSHSNSFDPDSDEFFENEHAVYEAFIDPANLPSQEEREQAMMSGLVDGNSSSSSENSISDTGSPMAVGSDDPAGMLADAYPALNWNADHDHYMLGNTIPVIPSDILGPNHRAPMVSQYAAMFDIAGGIDRDRESGGGGGPVRGTTSRQRSATVTVLPDPRAPASRPRHMTTFISATDNLPRTSNITPINIPVGRSRMISNTTFVSSPPRSNTSSSHGFYNHFSGSSSNNATPTQYAWSRRAPATPTSPTQNGPLTNPNARMSLTHIAPTLIRVQDVVM